MINEVASAGFGAGADAYDRGRPSYPAEVVDLVPVGTVVDVGAGTGKFTTLLRRRGSTVVAIEPVAAMRARIVDALTVGGAAESLPVRGGVADAVTMAQAFHWVRRDSALAEAARVLRPGGVLLLVWNERDESVPWVQELGDIYNWGVERPYPKGVDWAAVVDGSGLFETCRHRQLTWDEPMDPERLVQRVLSTSYVATWPNERQDDIARRVGEHVAGFGPSFQLPYVTDVYWCSTRS